MANLRDLLTGQPRRSALRDLVEEPSLIDPAATASLRQDAPLEQGITTGLYNTSIGSVSDAMLADELSGNTADFAKQQLERNRLRALASESAPPVTSYQDVHGLRDALEYGLGSVGQGAASMAPVLAGAAAGRLLGVNPTVAAAIPAYLLEKGEAVSNQYDDPKVAALAAEQRQQAAQGKGLINAGLEAAVPGALAKGFLHTGNPVGTIAKSMLEEGLTEGLQERVGQAAQQGLATGQGTLNTLTQAPSGQDLAGMTDASIMGALTGGAVSTPTAGSQALANTGKFGLDQAKKVPSIFQGDEGGAEGPVNLKDFAGGATEHIKQFFAPQEGSARHSRPVLAPEAPETDANEVLTKAPERALAAAQRVIVHGGEDFKWAPEALQMEAVDVSQGKVTDPVMLATFLGKVRNQDRINTIKASAEDLGKPVGEKLKALSAKAEAALKDVGEKLTSSKANLQNPTIGAREDISQLLFDNLKPEALQDAKLLAKLPTIASKIALVGTVSRAAQKAGLTFAQYAQRTGDLSAEDMQSLDLYEPLRPLIKDPKKLAAGLKELGLADALTQDLPRKSLAVKDLKSPSSTIRSLLTDEAKSHGPEYIKGVAKLVDQVAETRRTPDKNTAAQFEYAFGKHGAKLLLNMYANQVNPPKAAAPAVGSQAVGAEDVAGKTPAESKSALTEKELGSKVDYEFGGTNADEPIRLDTKEGGKNALRRELALERSKDVRGGFIDRPKRSVVSMEQVAAELHPESEALQEQYLRRHALKVVRKIVGTSDKGASEELKASRDVDRARLAQSGLVLPEDGKVKLAHLKGQMPAVRALLKNYGAKRIETAVPGKRGTGPTFRLLKAAGRKGVRLAEKMKGTRPERAGALRGTQFSYLREENGKTKRLTLSADSLVRHYRKFGGGAKPEQLFQEALADLLLSDPKAVPGSLKLPEGFKILSEGPEFQLEPEARKGPSAKQREGHAEARGHKLIADAVSRRETAVERAEGRLDNLYQAGSDNAAELEGFDNLIRHMREEAKLFREAARANPAEVGDAPRSDRLNELVAWKLENAGRAAALREVATEYESEIRRLVDERMVALTEAPQQAGEEPARSEGPRVTDEHGEVLHPREDDLREQRKPKERRGAQADNFAATTHEQILRDKEVAHAVISVMKDKDEYLPLVSKGSQKAFQAALAKVQAAAGPQRAALLREYARVLDTSVADQLKAALKDQNKTRFAREKADRKALEKTQPATKPAAKKTPTPAIGLPGLKEPSAPSAKVERTASDLKYNSQAPIGDPAFQVTRKQIRDEVERITGIKMKRKDFTTGLIDGGVGAYDPVTNKIALSMLAGTGSQVLSVAYHESLHKFFSDLSQGGSEAKALRRNIMRAAEQMHVRKQLATLLAAHPKALEQIESDPEERAAYLFQFWAAGKLSGKSVITLPPALNNAFGKVIKFFQELFGVLSHDQRLAKVFDALYDGKFAQSSLVGDIVRDMKLESVGDKMRRISGPLAELADKLLLTASDRLRAFGSAPLDELATMFHKEAGFEGGKAAFLQRRSQVTGQRLNDIAKVFDGTTATERKQALRNLQAQLPRTGALEQKIDAFLNRMRDYMVEAGVKRFDPATKKWVDLGNEPLYFPRNWDAGQIAKHEDEFRAMLKLHGNMSDEDISALITNIQSGSGQEALASVDEKVGFTPFAASVDVRKLDFINPSNAKDFVKFQTDDLAEVLKNYTYQAVHRAEFARDFGNDGGRITAKLDRAARDLSADQMREAQNTVKALLGTLGADMNPRMRQIMSAAITAENLILLPLTIFSQFIDALGVGLRSGQSADAWSAFSRGITDLLKAVTRQGKDADTEMAETLGLIDSENMIEMMGQVHGGQYMSRTARTVNRTFFHWNGMETWNRSMRVAAMVAGERFILREKGNARYMRELGLDPADIVPTGDGRLAMTADQIQAARPAMSRDDAEAMAQRVQQAQFRFVDGAVLRPNAAQRPVWGSDPHFMLIFHLKQFAFSFQKTILARVGNELDHGRVMPAAILAAYVPVTLASVLMKSALTGHPIGDGSMLDAVSYAFQRSGVLGVGLGFGSDSLGDLGRGQLPGTSALGPTLQHAYMAGRFLLGDPQIDGARLLDRTTPF